MLRSAIICAAFLSIGYASEAPQTRLGSVTLSENGRGLEVSMHTEESYLALDRSTTLAWGNFTNAINQTGWSFLEIKTNEHFEDVLQVLKISTYLSI